jgi:hypothetical protein
VSCSTAGTGSGTGRVLPWESMCDQLRINPIRILEIAAPITGFQVRPGSSMNPVHGASGLLGCTVLPSADNGRRDFRRSNLIRLLTGHIWGSSLDLYDAGRRCGRGQPVLGVPGAESQRPAQPMESNPLQEGQRLYLARSTPSALVHRHRLYQRSRYILLPVHCSGRLQSVHRAPRAVGVDEGVRSTHLCTACVRQKGPLD